MTRIKLCGLTRNEDIAAANALRPDYVGFVFAPGSRRRVSYEQAAALKERLDPGIQAVGVFTDAAICEVSALLNRGVIDLAQLHGHEDEAYLAQLRCFTSKPIIRALRVKTAEDVRAAEKSRADLLLFDAGAGSGTAFDWNVLTGVRRPYLLAGGLDAENVPDAIRRLRPFGVDVSSGIETGGYKDNEKMAAFVAAVRKEDGSI